MKRTQALRTITRLWGDAVQEVRTSALEVMGEVIYTFNGDDPGPPDEIVHYFIGEEGRDWHDPESPAFDAYMAKQAKGPWSPAILPTRLMFDTASGGLLEDTSGAATPISPESLSDPARALICAFNFPAVILTLGRHRWHELRGLYLYLAMAGAVKVRQTLAASMGEVAKVIGPEHARKDLVPRWMEFAKCKDSVVRRKAMESMGLFLQMLDVGDRRRVGACLVEVWDHHLRGWREREELAKVFCGLVESLEGAGCTQVVGTLLRRLLRDGYAAVRNAAIAGVRLMFYYEEMGLVLIFLQYPEVVRFSRSHPALAKVVADETYSLSADESFKRRIT